MDYLATSVDLINISQRTLKSASRYKQQSDDMDTQELQNFPNLFIFDQLRAIDQIISIAGSECNPNEAVLSILSESLRKASQGGRIEISARLPDWIKKQKTILTHLPEIERKLICLDSLVSELEGGEEISDKETALSQIAGFISGSTQKEYPLIIKKLPAWIQEHDEVFYLLKLEDKIKILWDNLKGAEKTNPQSIIQRIVKTLSKISESECQQVLSNLPHWVKEEEEIIPFLAPDEKIRILSERFTSNRSANHESTVGQIVEILSKLSMGERGALLENLPRCLQLYDSIFVFLPFEDKLSYLWENFSAVENQEKDIKISELQKFLILKGAHNPEVKNFRKAQLQEWLTVEYELWLVEYKRQEQEKAAIQQFATLKEKYSVKSYENSSPLSPLYPILIKIDSDELLEEGQIEFLKQNRLFGTLALYCHKRYKITNEPWELVKASGYWRDNSQPNISIQITEDLLNQHNSLTGRIRGAIFTTRGGAFRDLRRLDEAEHCANSAIQVDPSNYYPYNLLGAIYFERGNAARGEEYFFEALVLGAPQRSQEEQMKGALKNAGQVERQAVAQYLLQRDPVKYKWATYYL